MSRRTRIGSSFLFGALALCAPLAPAQDTSPLPPGKLGEDRLEGELRHVDPGLEGWNTEVLSSQAQDRLQELARKGLAGQELPDWIDASVVSSALRPAELVALPDTGSLRIARGPIPPERARGPEALAAHFAPLAELLGGREPHVKFKVVRVQGLGGEMALTQGLFRTWTDPADPSESEGVVQSDAIWTATRRHTEGAWQLVALSAEAYSESAAEAPLFTDCTVSVLGANASWGEQLLRGTDDWCSRIERAAGMDQYAHCGLTVGDFDGDGREDLYVCQPGGLPNRLFLQQPDGSAVDRSAALGLDWLDNSRTALLADLDGDRRAELALATDAGLLLLRRSDEGPYEVAAELPSAGGYSLTAADADGDGLIDLYVCHYATSEKRSGLPSPYHDANNGPPNTFFKNKGNLEFEEATAAVGLDRNNTRFSFAASWADYDRDGDPDLYVANDFGRNNLYRNDGGRFTDVAGEAGVEDISAGMGVSWGDYDGDGWEDVYVSNMFSSAGQRIAYQRRFQAGADEGTRQSFQRHARGNSLFRNRGDGRFEDVTVAAGAWMGRWSWGAEFVDLDDDGRQDLFVPNGFVTNESTKDL